MDKNDPGPGYRLLRKGERLKDGDEYFDMGLWRKTVNQGAATGVLLTLDYRRKITPGPGFRLLEDGEIIPPVYEWLDGAEGWRKNGNRAGVRYAHKAHGFCRTAADAAPYRPETMSIQNTTLPIPGSPEDKASLAELDSLIPAPKSVNIVAPWPSADECRKSLEAAGIKPEDFAKSPGAQILQQDFQALENKIHGTLASMGLLHLLPKPFTPNKYTRDLLSLDGRRVPVDVYSVLAAFPSNNSAVDHALKKLLAPGQRGQKGRLQDLKEARASLDRAIQMEGG